MLIYATNQDPVINDFGSFLYNYGYLFAIAAAVIVAAFLIAFLLLQSKKKKTKEVKVTFSSNEVLEALGGKDNIEFHTKAGSRISLVLKDYSLVQDEKLNRLGVDSIIKMSNKITLVVKDDSDSFYKMFDF